MLRTDKDLYQYFDRLYESQVRKDHISKKSYQRGDLLLQQKQEAHKVFLIFDGMCKCYFREENDKEFIVEFLGAGEIVGDVEFFQKTTCLCNIEALTAVKAFAISHAYFAELIAKDLSLNHKLLQLFSKRILHTSERASYQQLYSLEHNLAKLLKVAATESIAISKEDMAAYLGITLRSLNRSLKNIIKT